MKKINYLRMVLTLGIGWVAMNQSNVQATDIWDGASETLSTDNTLYHANGTYINDAKKIIITTSGAGKTIPLGGWGIYLGSGNYDLQEKEIVITTTGSAADAVRTNSEATFVVAKSLTIDTAGSSADGINLASNFNNNLDSWVNITDAADIRVKSGIAVRANNFQNGGARSVISLPQGSYIEVYGTGTASNASAGDGYAVYAGNRDRDTNALSTTDILSGKNNNTLGSSYVFIGEDSIIKTATIGGYGVYANKGGFIQLGDGVNISTTGKNAMTIYAATEQQGTYATNVRSGTVFLTGGATLRSSGSLDVIKAKGVGSVIVSKKNADPIFPVLRTDRVEIEDISSAQDTRGVFDIEGNINAISGGKIDLNFADQSLLRGSTSVDLDSIINLDIQGDQSKWIMTKNSTMSNLTLTDGATVYLSDQANLATRQVLTITDDYHGTNGKFVFNGVLDGDGSPIDKVIINGNATGTTKVAVNNLGGLGEKTINGIQIIQVDGTSLAGTFTQAGRIVAGAYDYFVTKGDELGNDTNNWYLTNKTSSKEVINPEFPNQPIVRPEGGAYLGNAYGANNLFQLTLHDRVGEVGLLHWKDDGLKDKSQNIWAHVNTKKVSMDEKSEQIRLKQDYNSMRVGFDLVRKKENARTYLFGIMGGYGQIKTHGKGLLYEAEGNISGYNVGLYGTIYDEHPGKSGKYLDTWVSWNDFDGQVAGGGLAVEKYGLSGVTASIEAGYDQLARKNKANENRNLWLKWQAQVTYQGVSGDGHREENGTYVSKNDDNIQTRLGVRLYQKVKESNGRWYQPYAELNWYHNTGTYDISMDGDRDFSTAGVENMGELKLGYEGQISKRLQLWGNISGGLGSKGAYTYGARLGLKYTF